MKRILYLTVLSLLAFSCTVKEDAGYSKGNPDDIQMIPENGPDDKIVKEVFDLINLDYPGMEKVKKSYQDGQMYVAAAYLLDYYRMRTGTENINVDLIAPQVNDTQRNMADQATPDAGYRFYVNNYAEGVDDKTGLTKYWSFMKDGKIDWNFTPEGVTDQEWFYQKHRLQWVVPQAKTYRVTRNEKYIQAWKAIYGDWLEKFPCPEGKINSKNYQWHGLQTTSRLIDQLSAFDYYKYSVNFTPEWLTVFLKGLYDHAESILANPFNLENSNIRLAQYQALTMAGMLMPEFKRASDWFDYGSKGVSLSLVSQFNEDGVHNELDPSYHLGVLADFINLYQLAAANNAVDKFPANYNSYLRKASRFIMDIVYPNYSIDNYNDTRCGSSFTKNVILRNLRSYLAMFPDDEELRYMSTQGISGTKPSDDVRIYDKSGYYMFRSGWNAGSMMLVLKNNYNPDNKWHCQPDNGTISLYNKGRRFLPDAGVFTYGGSAELNKLREAFRSTSMHNTMTKETATISSSRMKGEFLGSGSYDGIEYVVTKNDSYPDLSHRRAVFFVNKKFFVILDEGYGTGDGIKVNIAFNLCPAKNDVVPDTDYPAGQYGAHTIFGDGNNMAFKTFTETVEGYEATNSTNYFSDKINEKVQRRYYRVGVSKAAGKAARFITVIVPFGSADSFNDMQIYAEYTDNEAGSEGTFHSDGASAKVTVNGETYNISYKLK